MLSDLSPCGARSGLLASQSLWRVQRILAAWLIVGGALLCGSALRAEDAPEAAKQSAAQSPAEELAAKRKALRERIVKLAPRRHKSADGKPAEAETSAGKAAAGKSPEAAGENSPVAGERPANSADLEDELDLLRSLDLVYVQSQASIERKAELEKEKKSVEDELDSLHNFGPAEPKPFSFLLSEDIRDKLAAETDREDSVEADLKSSQQLLQVAREAFEECESDRRKAREALEESKDETEKAELAVELKKAELNSRIAQETVSLRRVEIDQKTARRELSKTLRGYLKEKSERILKDVSFSEHDYQQRLGELSSYKQEFRRKLKLAEKLLQQHETEQLTTLATLAAAQADKSVINAATEAYQLARRLHHDEITLLNQRVRELDHQKHLLNCRYEMVTGVTKHDDLVELRDKVEETEEQFKETERSLTLRLEETRVDQATLYRRAHNVAEDNHDLGKWIAFQTEQFDRLAEVCETSLMHVKSLRRAQQRFMEDLDKVVHTDKDRAGSRKVVKTFGTFWNYEFASVDDRPITIGKIVSGMFYLILGVLLAKLISRIIAHNVLPRLGLNEGAIGAIRSITFYSLCILFSLLSLELVNLPFAAFTFLGGAVAIAFGFGSQNILNNFISGLILLAEQPIRVGDLVELEGMRGTVEHIGARSTRVKTMSNHEIIVPNSILLENKVTNLTLSDNLVRTAIGVSLAPRLPVDEVRRRLYDAAINHELVLKTPQPVVLFLEFSTSTLSFELHFWLKMNSVMECRMVESEVRETINNALRDTGAATTAVTPVAITTSAPAPPTSASPGISPAAAAMGVAVLTAATMAASKAAAAHNSEDPPTLKLGPDKHPQRHTRRDAG